MLVAPDEIGVEDLLVGEERDSEDRDEDDEVKDAQPVLARERLAKLGIVGGRRQFLARQVTPAEEIDDEPDDHYHACTPEAVMPADLLSERPRDEGRNDDADVDEDVEDLERHRP